MDRQGRKRFPEKRLSWQGWRNSSRAFSDLIELWERWVDRQQKGAYQLSPRIALVSETESNSISGHHARATMPSSRFPVALALWVPEWGEKSATRNNGVSEFLSFSQRSTHLGPSRLSERRQELVQLAQVSWFISARGTYNWIKWLFVYNEHKRCCYSILLPPCLAHRVLSHCCGMTFNFAMTMGLFLLNWW